VGEEVSGDLAFTTGQIDGPAPEAVIVRDMFKKLAIAGPILVLAFGLIWGLDGALSTAYGLAIVIVNFALAAAFLAAALFGYLIRLGLILAAILLVRDASWIKLAPLGITIIVAHLGLLFWEMKYISASLAFPALKPKPVSKETILP
jgi:hypothetical protein